MGIGGNYRRIFSRTVLGCSYLRVSTIWRFNCSRDLYGDGGEPSSIFESPGRWPLDCPLWRDDDRHQYLNSLNVSLGNGLSWRRSGRLDFTSVLLLGVCLRRSGFLCAFRAFDRWRMHSCHILKAFAKVAHRIRIGAGGYWGIKFGLFYSSPGAFSLSTNPLFRVPLADHNR